jgi:hypothetical protein
LLWLAFLGLVLGYQFLLVRNVLKSMSRMRSEEELAATSLLLEYFDCSVKEIPKWVQCRHKHPAFSESPWSSWDWGSLGEAVSYDLDRYDPKKNAFLGLVLLGDEMLSKLPLVRWGGWDKTIGSSRILSMKELDDLITSHVGDDVKRLYPKEVYHLRVNFLRDYLRCEDECIYDDKDDEGKPWDKRWYWLYGYDLPEELPVLRFCKHCLGHLKNRPPSDLDEQELRARFAEVHEEYFPNNMQRVGGSWLRPREGFRVQHPFFTFRPLTEAEEAVLERIARSASVGLMTGDTTVEKSILGETDEELDSTLKTIWKFCGHSPEEDDKRCVESADGQDVSVRSQHVLIRTDMVRLWQKYKETKRLISCPNCREPGLRKKRDGHVLCPHCGRECQPEELGR